MDWEKHHQEGPLLYVIKNSPPWILIMLGLQYALPSDFLHWKYEPIQPHSIKFYVAFFSLLMSATSLVMWFVLDRKHKHTKRQPAAQ